MHPRTHVDDDGHLRLALLEGLLDDNAILHRIFAVHVVVDTHDPARLLGKLFFFKQHFIMSINQECTTYFDEDTIYEVVYEVENGKYSCKQETGSDVAIAIWGPAHV